jgi:hypothetical protein
MLKNEFGGQNWSKLSKKWVWKKSTVRENFGRILMIFDPKVAYRDLSKNSPHKKHCAWGPTPPWDFHKFYWFLTFFIDFGVFNRAGKTVSKIGIYALPPLKSDFYGQFMVISIKFGFYNILAPILSPYFFSLFRLLVNVLCWYLFKCWL